MTKIRQGFPITPTVAFLDSEGNISPTWYQFLVSLWKRTGSGEGQTTVTSVAGQTGDLTVPQLEAGGIAPVASPALTGTPTAPTAANGTNNTQIANTAFVQGAIAVAETVLAPIASPSFTGVPTAPTPAVGTNNTQIATTQFVADSAGDLLPAFAVFPSASPFNYRAGVTGSVLVAGGTVSSLKLRRGLGTTYDTGVVAGAIRVGSRDTLIVTYSVIPVMAFFPS